MTHGDIKAEIIWGTEMNVLTVVITPRPSAAECPQGGRHEWTISGHIATCSKCGASQNVS